MLRFKKFQLSKINTLTGTLTISPINQVMRVINGYKQIRLKYSQLLCNSDQKRKFYFLAKHTKCRIVIATLQIVFIASQFASSVLYPFQHSNSLDMYINHSLIVISQQVKIRLCVAEQGAMIITFLSTSLCIFLLSAVGWFLHKLWWTPIRVQYILRSQGIKGPPYKFLYGTTKQVINMRDESISNPMDLSHHMLPRILPHIYAWKKLYGINLLVLNLK